MYIEISPFPVDPKAGKGDFFLFDFSGISRREASAWSEVKVLLDPEEAKEDVNPFNRSF